MGPSAILPTWSSWYAVGAVVGRTCATQRNPPSGHRHPQQQVGEGQVGEQLPVAGEPVQLIDVGRGQSGVLLDEITQRGHVRSLAHGAVTVAGGYRIWVVDYMPDRRICKTRGA